MNSSTLRAVRSSFHSHVVPCPAAAAPDVVCFSAIGTFAKSASTDSSSARPRACSTELASLYNVSEMVPKRGSLSIRLTLFASCNACARHLEKYTFT